MKQSKSGFIAVLTATAIVSTGTAQTLEPEFAKDYALTDLGSLKGLPPAYAGVTFLPGDSNTLLIGGNGNDEPGAIYSVPVERNCVGHIVAFAGPPTLFATAPFIDGGLVYGPNDVLFFTAYPTNELGQIKPGSTAPDKTIDLTPLGVNSSVGTFQITPPGYPGAGSAKLGSYDTGDFYDAEIVPDGDGTFDLINVVFTTNTGGGPEGLVYIDESSPQFTADAAICSLYDANEVVAFDLDADGNPIPATSRLFMTGLEGAEGAAIDPATGDFVFSTFGGGDRVIVVRGFSDPCRADFDSDLDTGILDLLELLGAWDETCVEQDVNEDAVVDVLDLLALLALWGSCV